MSSPKNDLDNTLLMDALDGLGDPPLEDRFAARVFAAALRELPSDATLTARIGLAARGALIPTLLGAAGIARTVLTVDEVTEVEQQVNVIGLGERPPP